MVALALIGLTSGQGLIDPSLVDLLLTFPASSSSYPTVGRALVELGEDELAFRVLTRWDPPRNRELYDWHRRDRNAAGMLAAISSPYPGAPTPILELIYRQNDASMRSAVRFVLDADLRGENLGLLSDQSRRGLAIKPGNTQLLDLAVLLMSSGYGALSARLFERYLQRDYGGDTEVAKYLALHVNPAKHVAAFLPGGLSSLSTDDLVMSAATQRDSRFDSAAIAALLYRDNWPARVAHGIYRLDILYTFVSKLERSKRHDVVAKLIDRFEGQIEAYITESPGEGRYRWGPLMVKYGHDSALVRAAEANWPKVRETFTAHLSKSPQSADSGPVETIAILFALGGDDVQARAALDLARTRSETAPATQYSDLYSMRLTTLGKCEEAMERHLEAEISSLSAAVHVGAGHIQHCDDSPYNKRRMGRRLVDQMLLHDSFFNWQLLATSLVQLGMNAELRVLVDAVGKRPHLSDDQREDLFLFYLALNDPASAKRFAFPHSVKATFLLSVLGDWDEAVHGSKERLLDVDGRNVFEEGVVGFRQLVPEHPFWIGNFDFLFQGARGSHLLTERALAELRHCLTLVSDAIAASEAEDLIKRLIISDERFLINRATQRRVADALRLRLIRAVVMR